MMRTLYYLGFLALSIATIACNSTATPQQDAFSIEISPKKKAYQLGDTLQIKVTHPRFSEAVQQVSYRLHQRLLPATDSQVVLDSVLLGKQHLEVSVLTDKGNTYTAHKTLLVLAATPPKLYSYKIINEYAHDKRAYTQGLEFVGDTLVESTGQYGQSSLRQWNPFTGEMYKNIALSPSYFGEGATVFNGQILQLTWREQIGIVYDQQLNQQRIFRYGKSKEGWGLCHNGSSKLYKSDGTEKIWLLHPETFAEVDSLQLCTDKSLYTYANELEFANGKIYANTFLKDGIMIINPQNGAIEGVVDVRGLKEKVEQTPEVDVLNGIAYHPSRNTFFITGKNWSKIFEVVFVAND